MSQLFTQGQKRHSHALSLAAQNILVVNRQSNVDVDHDTLNKNHIATS